MSVFGVLRRKLVKVGAALIGVGGVVGTQAAPLASALATDPQAVRTIEALTQLIGALTALVGAVCAHQGTRGRRKAIPVHQGAQERRKDAA